MLDLFKKRSDYDIWELERRVYHSNLRRRIDKRTYNTITKSVYSMIKRELLK